MTTEPPWQPEVPPSPAVPPSDAGAPPLVVYPADIVIPAAMAAPTEPRPRRSRAPIVVIILLALGLLTVGGTLAYYLLQLSAANERIDEQDRQIQDQKDLIDKKETFGAAVTELLSTASQFDGVLIASVVPIDSYESTVKSAWTHRWKPKSLDRDIARIRTANDDLAAVLAAAQVEAGTNASGTTYEATIDQLSRGFATSLIDDADTLCQSDVLACVSSEAPTTVHFDAADTSLPYMTDFLRTGIAYHEFAHVLQFGNPNPTETALESFDGDEETMADCFALTYLDGWKLDHRIWVNSYSYYDVNIGYGYTCNDTQKQAVRNWYEALGFQSQMLSQ